MGNWTSKYIDGNPAAFATPFVPGPSSIVSDSERKTWKSYDYVIVGGGTAGCVLAARLSEDPYATVLLVEAGKRYEGNLFARIPFLFASLVNTDFDWNYRTSPQEKLGGWDAQWPRDYDDWENNGATGWGYKSLKPYFEKVEKQAVQRLGLPLTDHFSPPASFIGAGQFDAAVDAKNERISTASAYLTGEVLGRPNLTIAVSTFTEKILFSTGRDGMPTAVGVQLSTDRTSPKYAVSAKREVILSAGAVASPQLLLLSGVGPASHLKALRIPVVRDLHHVGRNLYDHFCAGSVLVRAKAKYTWDDYVKRSFTSVLALVKWLLFGLGPLASICVHVALFFRSDDQELPLGPSLPIKDRSSGPRVPDVEVAVFPLAALNRGRGVAPAGQYGVAFAPVILRPSSSGTISLRSASVYDPPVIDPNYLSDESDINILVKATRFVLKLVRSEALSAALQPRNLEHAPRDEDHFWPGDADPDKVTDDQLKTFIRDSGASAFHPTSSVRMGTSPADSAVDVKLRVHGVHGLRVVDASVFPDIVSGHPVLPVIAVAERAADLIRHSP
ncbi:hypothetical protein GSI_11743 [Ganoderma sinense ZZ0214-1]|uniref:Glucose-methanol-choline oxidoreductase N-terminal domain-containing protein n=1 Tax=Ganoderma sinense ZZ0214-1 TaxID=1077348 RepID=A0A2G8RWU4_9APHY|nr:hypothetical protein GSI_11743 [Ganoderma sinense ZZ0214-1]